MKLQFISFILFEYKYMKYLVSKPALSTEEFFSGNEKYPNYSNNLKEQVTKTLKTKLQL